MSSRVGTQLVRSRDPLQCRCQFLGFESKGSGLAFVHDAAVPIDQIDALGPACVRRFSRVVESVDDSGELDPQFANASSSHLASLLIIFRTSEENLVLQIVLRLPHVGRMRLRDVDDKERDLLPVLVIQLVEGGNLPPERRSSIAAEHEHDRLPRRQRR